MIQKVLLIVMILLGAPFAGCLEDTQTDTPSISSPSDNETALPPPDGSDTRTATVTRVIDGDTVEITFENGEEDTVRLIGVDTPETSLRYQSPDEFNVPDTEAGRDWLLGWGDTATNYTKSELADEQVRIVTDPEADQRGDFGRLLAYIYLGETNFNYELVTQGLARRYDNSQFTYRKEFGQAEQTARTNNQGVWRFEQNASTPETPMNDD